MITFYQPSKMLSLIKLRHTVALILEILLDTRRSMKKRAVYLEVNRLTDAPLRLRGSSTMVVVLSVE